MMLDYRVYHICVKHRAHFIKCLGWMANNDNTTAYWSITVLEIKLAQVNIPVYHSLQGTKKDRNRYSPWIMWCMIKTKKHDLQVSNFSLVLHPNSLVRMILLFLAFDLSVLRGHSFFHPRHNGQWPPTSKDLYITFRMIGWWIFRALYCIDNLLVLSMHWSTHLWLAFPHLGEV